MGVGQIDKEQFENLPLSIAGREVILQRVEYLEDARGKKEATYGAEEKITAIFFKRTQDYEMGPYGRIKVAPAYMLSKIGDGVKKGDKVTVGKEKWIAWNAIDRVGIYVYSDLYLSEDEREDDSDYSPGSTGGNISPREDYDEG